MKLLICGGTGKTGGHLVRQALEQGHEVLALARNPDDLQERHPRLRVERGQVTELEDVLPYVAGQDAVLSAVGSRTRRKNT